MNSEDGLYTCVKKAVDMTIDKDKYMDGIDVAKVRQNLHGITDHDQWDRKFLFDTLVGYYIATCANKAGYYSGIKGQQVYFDKDTYNELISSGLVINAKDDADRCGERAERMAKAHFVKFHRDAFDGQMAMGENGELVEERSMQSIIDEIKRRTGTDG